MFRSSLDQRNKQPNLWTLFSRMSKVGTGVVIVYGVVAFLYGFIYQSSYRETLNADVLGVPFDYTALQVSGGIQVFLELKLIQASITFSFVFLLAFAGVTAYEDIHNRRVLRFSNLSRPTIGLIVFSIFLLTPVLLMTLILKPIKSGEEDALKFLKNPNYENTLYLKNGRLIKCNIYAYNHNGRVFFAKDGELKGLPITEVDSVKLVSKPK